MIRKSDEYNFEIVHYGNGKVMIKSFLHAIKHNYSKKKKKIWNRKRKEHCSDEKRRRKSKRDALRTSIKKIYEIMKSNHFEYFLTITFNSQKYDSHDYKKVYRVVSQYLYRIKKKCKKMSYLCVAGQGKNGSWHFHVCLANIEEIEDEFIPAINKKCKSMYIKGKKVCNVKSLNKIGFNTIIRIYGEPEKLASYLIKNIIDSSEVKGRKKYSTGGKLKKPTVIKKIIEFNDLYHEIKEYGFVEKCEVRNFSRKGFWQTYVYIDIDSTKKYDENFKNLHLDRVLDSQEKVKESKGSLFKKSKNLFSNQKNKKVEKSFSNQNIQLVSQSSKKIQESIQKTEEKNRFKHYYGEFIEVLKMLILLFFMPKNK